MISKYYHVVPSFFFFPFLEGSEHASLEQLFNERELDCLRFIFNSTGVIEMLGGAGGLVEFKASLLASHGFAALALAYFAYDDLPDNHSSLDMEYFEEAANWLSNHPKVLPHGIGVHAICFGSWIALLMASLRMNAIKTVVAISPIVVAWCTPFYYKGNYSDVIPLENTKKIRTEDGRVWRHSFSTVTDCKPQVSKYPAITPVENISCPVLLVFGTGDLNVNSDFATELIFDRLKTHGKEHLCSILCYPEAGHLIEPPYTPHCYASFSGITAEWTGDDYLVWGGEMNAHTKAQEDAWPKILSFLQRNLQHSSRL